MADDVHALSEQLARDPASLAFLSLGEALRREGRLDQARRVVIRGLERHPYLVDAHDLLARIYADERLPEKAFDEWDMVRQLAPGHPGAAMGIGFICFSDGRLQEAERYLREAQAGAPGDERIAGALAMVQRATAERADSPAPTVPEAVAESERAPAPMRDVPRDASPSAASGTAPVMSAPTVHATDPRLLFTTVLTAEDQTALLLDRDGFVLAGAYQTWEGRDIGQDIGAELSGVSDEATRATRHLGIGAWRSITFEAEAAMVAIAPTANNGLLVLAAGRETPLGLTRRLLDRCATQARAWLEGAG